jgi:APA family basic amino acid/polyamine antiporter
VPVLFALAMLWIMINTFFEKPVEAVIGIILVLTGVPIYAFWRKRRDP